MRKIAFTLCSNNYLGAAKVWVESFRKFHSDFELFIGLVDKKNGEVDYNAFGCTILVAEDVPMPSIDKMSERFNIVELNTTVKPFYLKYFFYTLNADWVIYMDPDIELFSPLVEVLNGLSNTMITLTPQLLSPVDDEFGPNDSHILPTGVFNLGFIALSKQQELPAFLDWWADRCVKYGYRKESQGFFYDQIWMNYVPVFYDSYTIIKNPAYNVANWNLHERQLSKNEEGDWCVNEEYKLAFFHYSHYNFNKPNIISSYNSRYSLTNRPDVAPIFNSYRDKLLANNSISLKQIVPYYKVVNDKIKENKLKEYYTFKRKLINKMTGLINKIVPD